ncbi:MAG: hypothetical protein NTW86_28800, partial [Candidatus Sumerlaeota bacterium]|nr:hypothetical protein [Candidatus Sumerlaeota bacterium]
MTTNTDSELAAVSESLLAADDPASLGAALLRAYRAVLGRSLLGAWTYGFGPEESDTPFALPEKGAGSSSEPALASGVEPPLSPPEAGAWASALDGPWLDSALRVAERARGEGLPAPRGLGRAHGLL